MGNKTSCEEIIESKVLFSEKNPNPMSKLTVASFAQEAEEKEIYKLSGKLQSLEQNFKSLHKSIQ